MSGADRRRVMYLLNSLCYGGAEKHTVTLANRMNPERFPGVLVYLKPEESMLSQLVPGRLLEIISLNVQRRVDFSAARALAAHIDRLAIDVILCATEYPVFVAWLATRYTRRRPRVVEVFHTTTFRTRKERLLMQLYRQLFRRLDLLIYVSSKQQQYWRAHGLRARRELVIHNGIDCQFFDDSYSEQAKCELRERYGFTPQDFVVGLCAALRPEKAHGDLLAALALLRDQGVQARGLLVGDGPERSRIEQRVHELRLTDSVAITGFQADVRPFIAACDVIALPSHSIETFSIAVLEAMALGKPAVMSRIGGAEEIVVEGETGYLYAAGDIRQLSSCLRALSPRSETERMGRAAAMRVRSQFAEDLMIARYEEQLSALS